MTTTTLRRHRGTVLALLAGPVVTTAGMAATPWEPESTSASYLETMAAHPTQVQVSAGLLVLGYALLGLAMFTVLRRSAAVSLKLRAPAAVLAFCMATILPGMVTVDWLQLSIAQQVPLADGVRIKDETSGALAIVTVPAVAGMVLGNVLVLACAWRARLVGVWAVPAAVLGLVAGAVAGPAGMIGGAALLILAYGAVAASVARPVTTPHAPAPVVVPIAA